MGLITCGVTAEDCNVDVDTVGVIVDDTWFRFIVEFNTNST